MLLGTDSLVARRLLLSSWPLPAHTANPAVRDTAHARDDQLGGSLGPATLVATAEQSFDNLLFVQRHSHRAHAPSDPGLPSKRVRDRLRRTLTPKPRDVHKPADFVLARSPQVEEDVDELGREAPGLNPVGHEGAKRIPFLFNRATPPQSLMNRLDGLREPVGHDLRRCDCIGVPLFQVQAVKDAEDRLTLDDRVQQCVVRSELPLQVGHPRGELRLEPRVLGRETEKLVTERLAGIHEFEKREGHRLPSPRDLVLRTRAHGDSADGSTATLGDGRGVGRPERRGGLVGLTHRAGA